MRLKQSDKRESILDELYRDLIKYRKKSKAVNFGHPDKGISRSDMLESSVLEIENYKGYNIKIIIKNNLTS